MAENTMERPSPGSGGTGSVPDRAMVNSLGMRLLWIPPGQFRMGSPPDEGFHNEWPQHAVTLTTGFWLGQFPVTQAEWRAVMGSAPSHFKGARRPVEQVSWHDCWRFVLKLSKTEGRAYCLPTEAEWEYACRAGTTGARYGHLDQVAWYGDNADSQTHEVGCLAANAWGLHDMLGNVWEWCVDVYCLGYPSRPQTDPGLDSIPTGPESVRPPSDLKRVRRGASYRFGASLCMATTRFAESPDLGFPDQGFRLCLPG